MLYDHPPALSVSVEADEGKQEAWAWAVHRDPDQMLMVRSRPDYTDPDQALEAGSLAAAEISCKLGIPVATTASSEARLDRP